MRSLLSFVTTSFLLLSRRESKFPTFVQAQQDQQFGGQIINPDEFKWFAAIRRLETTDYICSGALIGSRYVITAMHCVEDLPTASVIVEVGYYCRSRTNCRREHSFLGVRRWYQHEGGGDFALLFLDAPAPLDIQPAVPYLGAPIHPMESFAKNKKKGRVMTMVGAGRTGTGRNNDISFFVRKLDVRYLSPNDCRSQVGNPSLVTDFVVCSIPMDGNPCEGDSGSAIVVPGKGRFAGRDVVMAVHQFGPRNCDDAPDQAIGHFRLTDAASLLQEVVCEGESREDWCPVSVEGSKLHTLTDHSRGIAWNGLSFNSDGSRLISSSYDNTNKIWDSVSGGAALATIMADGSGSVYAGVSHPFENYFASGSFDGKVRLWSTDRSDKALKVFKGHDSAVWSVAWSPCGTKLASASTDKSIKVWSLLSRQVIATLRGHTGTVSKVAFHPDGTQLASSSEDGTIKLWDATTDSFDLVETLTRHGGGYVASISYSPDGKLLASASHDNTAKVWDVQTGKVLHDFRDHTQDVIVVAWSPDARLLATGSRDGTVRVWDTWNGGPSLVVLEHEGDNVHGLGWSPDGNLLASGYDSGDIVIWSISRR